MSVGKVYIGLSVLPAEYQQVEYIETDGHAYIQTTHQPSGGTATNAYFSNVTGGSTQTPLFGVTDSGGSYWMQWAGGDECFALSVGGVFREFAAATDPQGAAFYLDVNPGNEWWGSSGIYYGDNSETVDIAGAYSASKATNPATIFTITTGNGIWPIQEGLRLHTFKTYNGETLARDYVPCYRKSDNKPGLYDLVHDVFYTNASSVSGSEFICGPNASTRGIAQQISKIYVGVNGVARQVSKVYVGRNGVARQVYPWRTYLFSHETGDNNALTGGWASGNFYHRTNSGTNYSMTRMGINTWSGGYMISGSFSSSDGTSEKAMYVMTARAINLEPYRKLCCILDRYTSRDTNPMDAWFGVFNASSTSSTLTCQTNQLGTKFLASATHINNVNSGYESVRLEIDISSLTGSYIILYDNYHSNMNAAINIHILDIWLE